MLQITILLLCVMFNLSTCKAQIPTCEVQRDENGNQRKNGSRLCITLEIRDGRIAFNRAQSRFSPSTLFTQRLSITTAQAEDFLFVELQQLLDTLSKPYRFALSDTERANDDQGKPNDPLTNAIRTASKSWTDYLHQFEEWATSTGKELGVGEIFPEAEATAPGQLMFPIATAQESTALLIYEDSGYDPAEGVVRFSVADPINDWTNADQVQILLPGVTDASKKEARLKRIRQILQPLSGRPRCLDCLRNRITAFYRRLGLTPNPIFDNKGSSPLLITIIEGARIVGVSWLTLKDYDPNIDKVLYSLLTDQAFRSYLKNRTEVRTQKQFNYVQRTGRAGPYLNETRLQIQQLLVNQLGYTVSFSFAPNNDEPLASSFNLTIQKNSDLDEDNAATPETNNVTPESAPATANPEGVVTAHEQEKESATEFKPEEKTEEKNDDSTKDKKHYLGGGIEYSPGQDVRFFGLGQRSRFPLLPDSVNNFSVKGGGQGTAGGLGSINYFSDYVFFNTLHRRVSLQLTVASDLDANRNLSGPPVNQRNTGGLARVEFEPFRDRASSLLRFYAEGRHDTISLQSNLQPTMKMNLTTLDVGAFYLFENTKVENPRRIRVQPLLRFGLGLAADEPRFTKWLATGSFHQMLPGRFELDISGRAETASKQTPSFELPSFGGAEVVRGFRRDAGLGRKLWSLQNELWIPLPIGNDFSQGLKAMLREKVKVASFVDVGGLYDTVNVSPGTRTGLGLGVRFIYNPIIFKIDYGYGFGATANSGSRGKFYFSLGSNLPF